MRPWLWPHVAARARCVGATRGHGIAHGTWQSEFRAKVNLHANAMQFCTCYPDREAWHLVPLRVVFRMMAYAGVRWPAYDSCTLDSIL